LGDVGTTAVTRGSGLDRDDLVAHVLSLGLRGVALSPHLSWGLSKILKYLAMPLETWGTRYRQS
jgi:hypothetical protein